MRIFSILSLVIVLSSSCNQPDTKIPGNQHAKGEQEKESPPRESKNQITPGTYLCWQNNIASVSGRDLLGEMPIDQHTLCWSSCTLQLLNCLVFKQLPEIANLYWSKYGTGRKHITSLFDHCHPGTRTCGQLKKTMVTFQ